MIISHKFSQILFHDSTRIFEKLGTKFVVNTCFIVIMLVCMAQSQIFRGNDRVYLGPSKLQLQLILFCHFQNAFVCQTHFFCHLPGLQILKASQNHHAYKLIRILS